MHEAEAMRSIMSEEKKGRNRSASRWSSDTFRKYFPEATRPCKCSR